VAARHPAPAARARDCGDLHFPRRLGRVRLGADDHQHAGQAHPADRDRALPGPARDELGACVRCVGNRGRPRDPALRDVPASVRQRPYHGSAEGMIAIATGDRLVRHSVEVLKRGQARSGAFVASPTFPTYHFAWLRDGAFCAYALDLVGETDAAAAFHAWVARSIELHRPMIESAIARVAAGDPPPPTEMPPARYTLDGSLEQANDDPWPNFQVDGYGMWLWALAEHLDGRSARGWSDTVDLVARYLQATWELRSFSCWEELDGGEHASTIGAAIAGLDAAARLLDTSSWAEEAVRART